VAGKTITLKIKYSDFSVQTRSKTLAFYISSKSLLLNEAKKLLYQEEVRDSVRLLGISVANLNTEKENTAKSKVNVQLRFPF
jgi:DNA polymerase-4